jgi:hypothetical protein
MSNILRQAELFFEACETGQGWDGCEQHYTPETDRIEKCRPVITLLGSDFRPESIS